MGKYRLRNGNRRKAVFGTTEAAILGAATITAGATTASAIMSKNATIEQANRDAQSMRNLGIKQAESINKQNEINRQLQEQAIDFNREQNETNRDIQKDIQLSLQAAVGRQNLGDRLEAAKIQVRNGGSMRNVNSMTSSLRGRYPNVPFKVIDGGGVIPLYTTPEGYDLYEIIGNDHEHSHKTKGGKRRTGVGIKFASGNVVEGEGNQNSNQGELMLVGPNDAMFISKHNLRDKRLRKSFNPAQAVNAGMNPMLAYNIQEQIKDRNNISDSGNNKATVGGYFNGIGFMNNFNPINFSSDIAAPSATGVVLRSNNINRKLRNGGRCRVKALEGYGLYDLGAAGIAGLGNILGSVILRSGNNRAAEISAAGNADALAYIANAYKNWRGINLNQLASSRLRSQHAMPALRTATVNTATPRAEAERSLQRKETAIKNNSIVGSAMQNRLNRVESDYIDRINTIENAADQRREAIKQASVQQINDIIKANAQTDMYDAMYNNRNMFEALKYNADTANTANAAIGQYGAQSILGTANTYADAFSKNSIALSNAITSTAGAFSNVGANYADYMRQINIAKQMKGNAYNPNKANAGANTNYIIETEDNPYWGIDPRQNITYPNAIVDYGKSYRTYPTSWQQNVYSYKNGGRIRLRKVKC